MQSVEYQLHDFLFRVGLTSSLFAEKIILDGLDVMAKACADRLIGPGSWFLPSFPSAVGDAIAI
jgi:hypothetical protein